MKYQSVSRPFESAEASSNTAAAAALALLLRLRFLQLPLPPTATCVAWVIQACQWQTFDRLERCFPRVHGPRVGKFFQGQ